ncbi:MAG: reprolysin-like metallopeptidase [Bacteroidota bacterium]
MRQVFLPLLLMCCFYAASAQSGQQYWSSVQEQAVSRAVLQVDGELPTKYRSLRLDVDGIKQYLSKAPTETQAERGSSFIISLPMPDGEMVDFEVYNAPILMPKIAARYPMIQSFRGTAVDNPGVIAHLDYTDQGFHGAIRSPKGEIYIDPVTRENTPFYISYYTKDYPSQGGISCGVDGAINVDELITGSIHERPIASFRGGDKVELKEYSLVVATTGEFGFRNGNSVPTVLGIINTTVGRLNAIYEVDLATTFKIIDDNDKVIFLDGDDDPYQNPQIGGGLLQQNLEVLNDIIGFDNFDIGHVLTIACTDGIAGVASGQVCGEFKGRGVTCDNANNLLILVTRVLAHEIGHQFSAGHTWNHCPPSEGQYAPGSAFEPGSGSTIMSYAGTCGGGSNVAFDNDAYFHVGSVVQMLTFSRQGPGTTCGSLTETDNDCPTIELPYDNDELFFIPRLTPFKLVAFESPDTDNDGLTYCWEQYDLGTPTAPCTFPLRGPLFRSFPPNPSPERVVPQLPVIIDNDTFDDRAECLPDTSREITFRCTVRDNIRPGGGLSWQEVKFRATHLAGPFLVSSPNTGQEVWTAGTTETVTWDVANTDQAPVNAGFVNILLSTDSGNPPYIILAERVPNDGSHSVVVPDERTRDARVLVEANGNIFFDMSNNDFEIRSATNPGVTFEITPFTQLVCLPEDPEIGLQFTQFLGYDSLVTMNIDGLPTGAMPNFSTNPFKPSDGTNLSIDMSNVSATGSFPISLSLAGPNIDTFRREMVLDLVSNDFSAFEPTGPTDGATGIGELPTFSWTELPNVDEVFLEVATTPLFGSSIIETATVTGNSYVSQTILDKNTPYYWRIRPVNICGDGPFSRIQGFQVETSSCAIYEASEDLPLSIPGTGTPTVSSSLNIPTGGTISDLNILNLEGSHAPIRFLDATLIAPDATRVLLFSDILCGSAALNIGLDDEAPDEIPCPANDRRPHKPLNPLAAFNDKNSTGQWTMEFTVTNNVSSGGEILGWSLEICSNVNLSGPFLVNNEILAVKPGLGNPITQPLLLAEDNDNTPEELVFTIVEYTRYGSLFKAGQRMDVGSTFTQQSIDAGNIRYVNDGDDTQTADDFSFTVEDGDNGWLKATYQIEIDENAVTSTNDLLKEREISVFPNPAKDLLNIQFRTVPKGEMVLNVVDVQGRRLLQQRTSQANHQMTLATDALANGVYFLQFQWNDSLVTKKITIHR